MLTMRDENGFLIANFSDYFALIDYFLLTAYDPTNFNVELNQDNIKINDKIYAIEYHELYNNRMEEVG